MIQKTDQKTELTIKLLKKIARGVTINSSNFSTSASIIAQVTDDLQKQNLIQQSEKGQIKITPEGRSYLKRAICQEHDPFQNQHQLIKTVEIEQDRTVDINLTESPLMHLYNRKRKNGTRLISQIQLQAGERFRKDFERAQISPKLGLSLTPKVDGTRHQCAVSDGLESSLASRSRLEKALASVGKELGSLLLDICCFLKGLEHVERERQWPTRSAKVVLGVALTQLADHYGWSEEAIGRSSASAQNTKVWHADRKVAISDKTKTSTDH